MSAGTSRGVTPTGGGAARGWQKGGQPPWRRVARWRRTVNRWRLVTAGALAFTAPTRPPSPLDRHPLCSPFSLPPRAPPHFRALRKRSHRGCRVFGHLNIILRWSSVVTQRLAEKKGKKSFFFFFHARRKKSILERTLTIKVWSINIFFFLTLRDIYAETRRCLLTCISRNTFGLQIIRDRRK